MGHIRPGAGHPGVDRTSLHGRLSPVWAHAPSRVRIIDALLLFALAVAMVVIPGRVNLGFWSFDAWAWDAWAYWIVDPVHPYTGIARESGAFLYGPPVAQAATLLRFVPWDAFMIVWTAVLVGALYAMAPGRSVMLLLAPPVMLEVLFGNIHLLLAVAIVLGFRWPATWAFVLLTKVTPGIGLVWFAARREWRSVAMALGATAILAGTSFLVAPWMWPEWIARLAASAAQQPGIMDALLGPLWLRVTLGAAIALVGGLVGWRWTIVVACVIALPQLSLISFALLVALVPLVAMDRREPLPAMVRLPRWWPGTGRLAQRTVALPSDRSS